MLELQGMERSKLIPYLLQIAFRTIKKKLFFIPLKYSILILNLQDFVLVAIPIKSTRKG